MTDVILSIHRKQVEKVAAFAVLTSDFEKACDHAGWPAQRCLSGSFQRSFSKFQPNMFSSYACLYNLPFNCFKSGVEMFLRSKAILPLTLSLFNLSECWFPLTPHSNPMIEMTTTSKMQVSNRKFLSFDIVNTEHLLQRKWMHSNWS